MLDPPTSRALPALTLAVMAPILAEVLPGATRFSALFVLPIEMAVWGGGALLVRHAVRRRGLGWRPMLLLALVLSIAEEWVIQQSSLAPLVLQIRGVEYARALGVNYVYFLWAVGYEAVFVVFLPITLVELMFPAWRDEAWIGRRGVIATSVLFVAGAALAWLTWTRIARPRVFHVPAYTPPVGAVLLALAVMAGLAFAALGPYRDALARSVGSRRPPPPWVVGTAGAVWAVLWYGLVLLAFGIAPSFPPAVAVAGGLALLAAILYVLPRWTADPGWRRMHAYAVVLGPVVGAMAVGFIGFIGAARIDLYFKVIANVVALALLIALGVRVSRRQAAGAAR